jgi:ferredoxin-type protein NapF
MASHMLDAGRRQFLRGDFRGRKTVVRPPWAVSQNRFPSLCDRCGHCRDACRARIILLTDSGYPQIDFKNGACSFCGDCARSCPTGALQKPETSSIPWGLQAQVSDRCLAFQGVVCLVCGEQCDARAISFLPGPTSAAVPAVDVDRCNGCGACVAPCPGQAVSMDYPRAGCAADGNSFEEVACT